MSYRFKPNDPNETLVLDTYVPAMDLIKIVNQIYNDKMACVHISITSCSNPEHDTELRISAVPTMTSNVSKQYPVISGLLTMDFD